MKSILIAVDGSPGAREALRLGLELAAEQEAEVIVARAVSGAESEPEAAADLERAVQQATEKGLMARAELLVGDAVDEIVAAADSVGVDLIVVGSRGRGALTSTILGSVSRGVVHESRRAVLVVRESAPGPENYGRRFSDAADAARRESPETQPIDRRHAMTKRLNPKKLLSLGKEPRSLEPGDWLARMGKPRVLIENPDGADLWAHAAILREAGYDVAICGGPTSREGEPSHSCPLLERGHCELVEGADVVITTADLVQGREILEAHAARGSALVVEGTTSELERDAAVVAESAVVEAPVTEGRLLAAVEKALARRRAAG